MQQPGWYDDQQQPGMLRWWDGSAWTAQTMPRPQLQVGGQPAVPMPTGGHPPVPGAYPPPAPQSAVGAYPPPGSRPATPPASLLKANTYSFISMGVGVAYALLELYAHIVFIGILPVLLVVQAFQRKERLAPLALLIAGAAVVFALTNQFG